MLQRLGLRASPETGEGEGREKTPRETSGRSTARRQTTEKGGGGGRPMQGERGPGGSWEGCLGHHTWREVKPPLPQAG